MNLIKTSIFFICIVMASCNSSKSSINDEQGNTEEITDKTDMEATSKSDAEMAEEGYQKGIILAGKGKDACEYVIDIKGGYVEQKVDPTNLDDIYKKDQALVWVKFRGLRMMNRCPEARPVEITEIQKRAK